MNSAASVCQNCKQEFRIEPEDFAFYEKMKVPPPTWCPECRMIRRLAWYNTNNFYRRQLSDTGESVISMYSADKPFTIIRDQKWWSDEWEPLEYGREYNFSKSFFEQFKELLQRIPLPHLQREYSTMINSDYCNAAATLKNCYLVSNADLLENCSYGQMLQRDKDCLDIIFTMDSELCYEGVNLQRCYRAFLSRDCENCRDVTLCVDCLDCHDCFGSSNLRKRSYYIFNQAYSREEYFSKIKEMEIGSRKNLMLLRERAEQVTLATPRRFVHGRMNVNVFGEYVYESKNAKDVYDVRKADNVRYGQFLKSVPSGTTDSYDYSSFGNTAELIYESVWAGLQVSNLKFCVWNYGAQDLEYCFGCHGSKDLFGCVGLRKKQYCILNRQYSPEEFKHTAQKIKDSMTNLPFTDRAGRQYHYGEFFPPELSPFGYNETWAYDYFPRSKENLVRDGYLWKEPESKSYGVSLEAGNLPDHIRNIPDSILNEVIGCEHQGTCTERCTTIFRIIPQELEFCRKMNLPLPRLCPNCRHYQRIKHRAPMQLWHRKCTCVGTASSNGSYINQTLHFHGPSPCSNEFETSYAPERPEIVYCESCYQVEVV